MFFLLEFKKTFWVITSSFSSASHMNQSLLVQGSGLLSIFSFIQHSVLGEKVREDKSNPYPLPLHSLSSIGVLTISSRIILFRGVAGVDPQQATGTESSTALPVTSLKNAYIHILYLGPSSIPEIIAVAGPTTFQDEFPKSLLHTKSQTQPSVLNDKAQKPSAFH